MSTYSWSYKTASHRQVSAKQAETDQEGPDTNTVCQTKNDKVVLHSSSSQNNDAVTTGTPKRLNWKAKIYVGNLNKKTNEASLAYYFSVFGDIEDIKLIRDHDTKESRGFAFITFEKIESAENAKKWCSFNYPTLDDNGITVASAERKAHKIKISKKEQRAKRDPSQTLFWEFKWTNSDDAQVYGPYETSLMQAWKNQGYFDRGCWVRQVLHRQVNRAEEKHEVKANSSEVTLSEEIHEVKATNSEGNMKDETSAPCLKMKSGTKYETCNASPCKKPKLVIDYSDSEEEDGDGVEGCGGVWDTSGRSKNEGEKKSDTTGNNEYSNGDIENTSITQECDDDKRSKNEVEDESDTFGDNAKVEDMNECEREDVDVARDIEKTSIDVDVDFHVSGRSKINEERDKSEELRNKTMMKDREGRKSSRTVIDIKDIENEQQIREEENVDRKEMSKVMDGRLEGKVDVGNKEDSVEDNKTAEEMDRSGEDQRCKEGNGQNSLPEVKQDVRMSSDILPQYEGEHLTLPESDKEVEGKYDVLQMYEKRPTVLPESDEQSERKMNDEDLTDYSSSGEEDIENDTDDISTEFVSVSEIDFNLYP